MKSKMALSQIARTNFKGSLLVVDSHSICHAAKAVTGQAALSGIRTGVIYVFLRKILSICRQVRPDEVVFAWDSRRSLRKDISKIYKANRGQDKDPEQQRIDAISHPQFDVLRDDVLPRLGFSNIFIADGFEADDIIASVAICEGAGLNGNMPIRPVIVVTNDNDLLQILSDTCCLYNHTTGDVTTIEDFVGKWGIQPSIWAGVKAIAGCSGDNVVGCRGIGEVTAAKFIRGEVKEGSKTWDKIVGSNDTINKNLLLVTLPFEGTPSFGVSRSNFSPAGFLSVCGEYGMPSLANNLEEWCDVFGGR